MVLHQLYPFHLPVRVLGQTVQSAELGAANLRAANLRAANLRAAKSPGHESHGRLDPRGRPGLGAYVHAEFSVPVIGVAKTPFRGATHAIDVRRGAATRPLYVTSVGLPPEQAAAFVRGMAGSYRLPDALRRVDALARTASPSAI